MSRYVIVTAASASEFEAKLNAAIADGSGVIVSHTVTDDRLWEYSAVLNKHAKLEHPEGAALVFVGGQNLNDFKKRLAEACGTELNVVSFEEHEAATFGDETREIVSLSNDYLGRGRRFYSAIIGPTFLAKDVAAEAASAKKTKGAKNKDAGTDE